MDTLKPPFTNLQLELLRLYAMNLTEDQLLDIRKLLGQYFADRASDAMDHFVAEQGMTPEDLRRWAREHDRARRR